MDSWSPCHVGANRTREDDLCHGRRSRKVRCEVEGSVVPDEQCSSPPPSRETTCTTTCPQDCVVGPWGGWIPCVSCDASQRRTRTVIVAPTQDGAQCPPLSESRPCLAECLPSGLSPALSGEREEPLVRLRVGEWGPCQPLTLDPQPSMLDGTQVMENNIVFNIYHDETIPEGDPEERMQQNMNTKPNSESEVSWEEPVARLPPQLPHGLTTADLPQVGRQERELTCVHINGTRLALR